MRVWSLYSVSGAIYHECFIQPHRSPLASCWASLRLVACPGWLQRAKVINTCIVILMDPLPRKGIARSPWAFVRAEGVSLLTARSLCGTEVNGTRKHVCHHIQGSVGGGERVWGRTCMCLSLISSVSPLLCLCVRFYDPLLLCADCRQHACIHEKILTNVIELQL